ncbi:MAG: hypothetical protein JRH11_14140 [Deltaproteobacteria bacterium]|nr:hypothetical protein [Deltaproteobacteria bacterium]
MTNMQTGTLFTLTCFLFIGCAAATDPAEEGAISSALEMENGGYDMEPALPAFGEPELLESLQLLEADLPTVDPMEIDGEVVALRAAPDAVHVRVAIAWGQIPGDREAEVPHDWSGAFVVNRGAILARRTIRFEGRTDNLLPRHNPQVLPFTSATLPHNDGLVVSIIDPNPTADEPLVLTYIADLPGPLGSEGGILRVPVASLLDGLTELSSDADGNRMVAIAQARPVDVCQNGFLMGRWHRVEDGRGRFIGRVVSEDGELRGHVRGIYGVRLDESRVFFGKYINAAGEFRGIFKGEYADGHFRGRWVVRDGEVGVLGGQYREGIPGPETGGHFMGRWAETSCNLRL